jgi:hypothetical protein
VAFFLLPAAKRYVANNFQQLANVNWDGPARSEELTMRWKSLKPGDTVVYRKRKNTTHPGPRAKQIQPAAKGDYYVYVVDKFWVVRQVFSNGKLLVETRRGKRHIVNTSDPNLRRTTLWDHIRYHDRLADFR